MIKNILSLSICFLLFLNCNLQQSTGIKNERKTQKKFNIEKLHFYKPSQNLKLVVFVPSLYVDCEYASMLTNSLNYYFVKGLAFTKTPKPKIDVILIVNDYDKWERDTTNNDLTLFSKTFSNQNLLDGIIVNYDKEGLIYKSLGIETFKDSKRETNKKDSLKTIQTSFLQQKPSLLRNQSSKLLLLDENNNILLEDNDYRSQGEHLKPLENIIKKHLNIEVDIEDAEFKKLKVGDKAPYIISEINSPTHDINQNLNKKDSNIIKDTSALKIITFYPAAFSGTLPDYTQKDNLINISCAIQLSSFDNNPYGEKVNTYAVSSSKRELLDLWKTVLRTSYISYINDENYSISKKYNAYNLKGYNNRLTYLIDKKGIIRYIDYDYTLDDQERLQQEIENIQNEK